MRMKPAILLLIVCLMTALSAAALADINFEEGDWRYTILDSDLVRLDRYLGSQTTVTVPETLGEYTVASTEFTFAGTDVEKVIFPESVTEIGRFTFFNCPALKEVEAPGLTKIGMYAFFECTSLSAIDLKNVTEFGEGCFWHCTALTQLDLTKAETIDSYAFIFCTGLQSVSTSDTLDIYGRWIFGRVDPQAVDIGRAMSGSVLEMLFASEETCGYDEKAGCGWYITDPDGQLCAWNDIHGAEMINGRTDIISHQENSCIKDIGLYLNGWHDGSWFYTLLSDGTVKLVCCDGLWYTDPIEVPSEICSRSVSELGEELLKDYPMTSIVLPESLRVIGSSCFSGTAHLKEIVIPEGVTDLGDRCFSHSAVERITLPSTLTSLGQYVFEDCAELTELTLPEGMRRLTPYAFAGSSVKTLTVLAPEMEVEENAFFGCTSLKEIITPDGFYGYCHKGAFNGCKEKSIKKQGFSYQKKAPAEFDLSYTVLEDGTAGINGCSSIKTVTTLTIPEKINGIPVTAVLNMQDEQLMSSVTEIRLPEGITDIGDNAFSGYTKLKTVNLPASVRTIGENAFSGCKALSLSADSLPGSIVSIGDSAFAGAALKGNITLRSGVAYGISAFAGTNITGVTLESGTAVITNGLFEGCKKLKTLQLSDSLTEIGASAFSGCTLLKIKAAQLQQSVIGYGDKAFYGTKLYGDITLYGGVSYGTAAFSDTLITSVNVSDGVETITESLFEDCEKLETLSPGTTLASIGKKAFNGTALKTVKLPASMKELDYGCFYGCKKLKTFDLTACPEVRLPDSYDKVFYPKATLLLDPSADIRYGIETRYPKLKYKLVISKKVVTAPADPVLKAGWYDQGTPVYHLVVPEGVEEIGDDAFLDMKTLCSVKLPSTLKRIGSNAFRNCVSLTKITLPKGLESIGDSSFRGCIHLEKLTVPASVVSIGAYAFAEQSSLTGVSFAKGSKLETLGASAFADDPALSRLSIPASVLTIGRDILQNSGSVQVTVVKGSTAQKYINDHYPELKVTVKKK